MILNIHPDNPNIRHIKRAVTILKEGGIIAYPTDTTYGLGCDIFNKKAIEKLYKLKKQDKNKPLSIICENFNMASEFAKIPNTSFRLMKKVLPGPYTFILKASHLVPEVMLTRRKTIGIRIPSNNIVITLVKELKNPILNTTARPPEEDIFTNPLDIEEYWENQLDLIIDGGISPTQPTTVIDLSEDYPEVIRIGAGRLEPLNLK